MHPEASEDLLSYAGKIETEGSNAAALCGAEAACVGYTIEHWVTRLRAR